MKKVNALELRTVDGGASKYVQCPTCGYRRKATLFERLFQSNTRVQYYMSSAHLSAMKGYKSGKSAHTR